MSTINPFRRNYTLAEGGREAKATTVDNKLAELTFILGHKFNLRNLDDVRFVLRFLTGLLEDVDKIEQLDTIESDTNHLLLNIDDAKKYISKATMCGYSCWKLTPLLGENITHYQGDSLGALMATLRTHCAKGNEYTLMAYNKKGEAYDHHIIIE